MKDFLQRTKLSQSHVTILAEADALSTLNPSRRASLWNALAVEPKRRQRSLFDQLDPVEEPAALPIMESEEEVYADYRTTGFSLRSHPLAFQRERLEELGIVTISRLSQLPNEVWVDVAGIVLLRQRPSTAKGITFVTIEDETGTANLVVHQKTWERFRSVTRHSAAWIVHGQVESKHSVIHVVVRRVEDMAARLPKLSVKSRDFR
jgi:error-prone DNA polymerase